MAMVHVGADGAAHGLQPAHVAHRIVMADFDLDAPETLVLDGLATQ